MQKDLSAIAEYIHGGGDWTLLALIGCRLPTTRTTVTVTVTTAVTVTAATTSTITTAITTVVAVAVVVVIELLVGEFLNGEPAQLQLSSVPVRKEMQCNQMPSLAVLMKAAQQC